MHSIFLYIFVIDNNINFLFSLTDKQINKYSVRQFCGSLFRLTPIVYDKEIFYSTLSVGEYRYQLSCSLAEINRRRLRKYKFSYHAEFTGHRRNLHKRRYLVNYITFLPDDRLIPFVFPVPPLGDFLISSSTLLLYLHTFGKLTLLRFFFFITYTNQKRQMYKNYLTDIDKQNCYKNLLTLSIVIKTASCSTSDKL